MKTEMQILIIDYLNLIAARRLRFARRWDSIESSSDSSQLPEDYRHQRFQSVGTSRCNHFHCCRLRCLRRRIPRMLWRIERTKRISAGGLQTFSFVVVQNVSELLSMVV